jgi:hypothetical protein
MGMPLAQNYPQPPAAVRGREGKCRARTTGLDPYLSFVTAFFFLISLALYAPLSATASDPFTGKITSIDSGEAPQTVSIIRPAKKGLVQAGPGDAVFVGDTVKTGPGVKAQIALSDKSVVNIGPDSVFRVKGYVLSPEEAKRNYLFKALKGAIRFIISKAFKAGGSGASVPWKDSTIAVETPNAVAGVRGTDFAVVVETSKSAPSTDIAVFDGLVTVRNISLSVPDVILLSANEVTTVKHGVKPTKPEALSLERRNQLTRSTTPKAESRQQGGAPPAPLNKRAAKYTGAEMARDIAAGAPLPEALDQATAAGMTVGQMVAAAMDAGVEPSVVVYTAITEGYSPRDVVAAAIGNGAPLYDVIAAALAAGAEKKYIIAGAAGAGEPAADIASAVALASTGSAPVYGYGAELNPTVATLIPSAPILIGGGGGVTPSTLPASPYKP